MVLAGGPSKTTAYSVLSTQIHHFPWSIFSPALAGSAKTADEVCEPLTLLPFWTETENSLMTTSFTHKDHLEVTGTHPTFALLDVHQITSSLWLCLDYFCLRGLEMNDSVCYYSFTGPLSIAPSKNIQILHCSLHAHSYICISFSPKRAGITS